MRKSVILSLCGGAEWRLCSVCFYGQQRQQRRKIFCFAWQRRLVCGAAASFANYLRTTLLLDSIVDSVLWSGSRPRCCKGTAARLAAAMLQRAKSLQPSPYLDLPSTATAYPLAAEIAARVDAATVIEAVSCNASLLLPCLPLLRPQTCPRMWSAVSSSFVILCT